MRRVFEQAEDADRDHALASLPGRTLTPGYYRWAEYLLWLEERLTIFTVPNFATLAYCEMSGLVKVSSASAARGKLAQPACPCGSRMESRIVPVCPE